MGSRRVSGRLDGAYLATKFNPERPSAAGFNPSHTHFYLYFRCQKSRVGPAYKLSLGHLKGRRKWRRWPWITHSAIKKRALRPRVSLSRRRCSMGLTGIAGIVLIDLAGLTGQRHWRSSVEIESQITCRVGFMAAHRRSQSR